MTSTDDLNALRPLDLGDPDFAAAVETMKHKLSSPMVTSPNAAFWLLDMTGTEPADMVSVVDLKALGNIARGSPDWGKYSEGLRLRSLDDPYAASDVLESMLHRMREVRTETPAPSGP